MGQHFYRVIVGQVYRIIILLMMACLQKEAAAAGHMGHMSAKASALPGDILLFPDLTFVSRFDQGPAHRVNDNEFIPELNLFYTFDYKRFRFLGEWLVSTKSHNLERIQLGLNLGEASLWLARFHNPIGYWNTQYHHGGFLQNTVSRPGIMTFETAGGPIPNHLTGLLLEGIHEFGKAGLYYSVGAGAGPDYSKRLQAFNIVEPGGTHLPGATLRLGYQPVSYGEDEVGFSTAYTEIPIDGANFKLVKQFVASVYANWHIHNVHALGEAVYVSNQLDRYPLGGKTSNDFFNAYGQLEWDVHPDWILIGRLEGTLGARHDPYLELFPKFVEDRILAGVRYKLSQNMALKLEVSRDHVRDDHYGQAMFQWSAIFP